MPRLVATAGVVLLVGQASCGDKGTSPSSGLAATCSASPDLGLAPLEVALGLKASGSSSFDVVVDFGDGMRSVEGFFTASKSLSLPHVYRAPGRYAATFLVSGAGGQSVACSIAVAVTSGSAAGM